MPAQVDLISSAVYAVLNQTSNLLEKETYNLFLVFAVAWATALSLMLRVSIFLNILMGERITAPFDAHTTGMKLYISIAWSRAITFPWLVLLKGWNTFTLARLYLSRYVTMISKRTHCTRIPFRFAYKNYCIILESYLIFLGILTFLIIMIDNLLQI